MLLTPGTLPDTLDEPISLTPNTNKGVIRRGIFWLLPIFLLYLSYIVFTTSLEDKNWLYLCFSPILTCVSLTWMTGSLSSLNYLRITKNGISFRLLHRQKDYAWNDIREISLVPMGRDLIGLMVYMPNERKGTLVALLPLTFNPFNNSEKDFLEKLHNYQRKYTTSTETT